MHILQKLLIKRLVEENGRSYSSLTGGYDSEDNIAFHLKQLLASDFVEKREDRYFITVRGLNILNTFQKSDLKEDIFKKYFVGFVIKCGEQYLIKQHPKVKEPYYNLPSGTPLFGEPVADALARILFRETGIQLPPESFIFDSLHLKSVKTKEGEVAFDDVFGVYSAEISESAKNTVVLGSDYLWQRREELSAMSNVWPEIKFCILREDWEVYKTYTVTRCLCVFVTCMVTHTVGIFGFTAMAGVWAVFS